MFNILKKKKEEKEKEDNTNDIVNKKKEEIRDYDKEIKEGVNIYVMPERFRAVQEQKNKAKATGLIIIISGVIFLIAASIFLYFYLFKSQPEEAAPKSTEAEVEANQPGKAAPSEEKISEPEKVKSPKESYLEVKKEAEEPKKIEINPEGTAGFIYGIDSDGDGLTDKEENALASDPEKDDSDGDGYKDMAEVENLYNPAGEGKIEDSANIEEYTSSVYNFKLLYPSSWSLDSKNSESIIFKSNDNQFIQAISQNNTDLQSIDDYYKALFSVSGINPIDRVSGGSWQGIRSPDGLSVYLTDSSRSYIFTLSYSTGISSSLEYKNIFEMMLKSFDVR